MALIGLAASAQRASGCQVATLLLSKNMALVQKEMAQHLLLLHVQFTLPIKTVINALLGKTEGRERGGKAKYCSILNNMYFTMSFLGSKSNSSDTECK